MTKKANARLAGFTYLLVVITGIFSLAYTPSQLIVWGDAALTFNNISGAEFLFRMSIVSGIFCYLCFLALPFILYSLLKPVNKTYALSMVVLAAISVPMSLLNIINKLDILTLLSQAEYLNTFELQQLQTQVMLKLRAYQNGLLVIQVFWGLWLFPFGYLVFKSGFIPKIFGILLMLGCFSYLLRLTVAILFPEFDLPSFIRLTSSLAEIGTCLWLLIMGVNTAPEKQP